MILTPEFLKSIREKIELADNLEFSFLHKKINDASRDCLINPNEWAEMDLLYWSSILQIKIALKKTPKEQLLTYLSDAYNAEKFYQIIKQ